MIPEFTCVVREQGTLNWEQGTEKTELIPTESCMATPRRLSKIGVAELGYEIQKSMISNSYSLRLDHLCVFAQRAVGITKSYS